jgi:hypothetical protein
MMTVPAMENKFQLDQPSRALKQSRLHHEAPVPASSPPAAAPEMSA